MAKESHEPEPHFKAWYDKLRHFGGAPAKGTLSGALVILERLKTNFDLRLDSHTTEGSLK